MTEKKDMGLDSKFPPRIKIALKPGRLTKFWADVKWASEEFVFDHFRDQDGEEVEYISLEEHEALLLSARAEADAFREALEKVAKARKIEGLGWSFGKGTVISWDNAPEKIADEVLSRFPKEGK
jgi:hypothetical protein